MIGGVPVCSADEPDGTMRFQGLRILLVAESGPARGEVAAMVRRAGVDSLEEAATGAEALARLEDRPSDLLPDILMVGHLPDGAAAIAFIRKLRADASFDFPVIFLSRYNDLWRLDQARQAGANEFLVVEGAGQTYGMAGAEKAFATELYNYAGLN